MPPLLELPGAQRAAVQSSRGGTCERRVAPALTARLRELCRAGSATLFMALLAAFQCLLRARTGGTDLVVGTDVAGRDRAELEGLIGFFVNQLVLRTDLSGDPGFLEVLGRTREVALGAYAHQEMPFDRLVELLVTRRRPDAAPLVQVKLVLQNVPQAEIDLPGLRLLPVAGLGAAIAQLDLNLRIFEGDSGLHLSLQYSSDVYSAGAAESLLEDYERVLAAVAADPQIPLSGLCRLLEKSAVERQSEHRREVAAGDREKLRKLRREAVR
jgi:non-ribosomal peptide synthetase component F